MKKIITCLFIIFVGILFANPIVEGPYITEIYFDETGWSIELYNMMIDDNLDNCKISSNAGDAYFLSGISFPQETIIVVTQDDLQTLLVIDEQGDHITSYYEEYEVSWCTFGTLQTMVLAPTDGQSLVPVSFSSTGGMTTDVSFCKDNTPTLGGINNNGGIQGVFSGYVFDSLMNPVPNVQIEHFPYNYDDPDVFTNENGYFEKEMYALNFYCDIHLAAQVSMDSIISIEPDSINYYEFVFEDYVSSDNHEISLPPSYYNLTNYPNPFNPTTEISFSVPQTSSSVTIEIFNSRGQKVKTLDCSNSIAAASNKLMHSIIWNGTNETGKSVPSGVYFYKLVSNGNELAVNKMLLLK
ncbi:MAG: FlgD immunoglobulin-like domain containing protein [Candidatus Cloacimonadota bacterium]|nr:FlgD immunoglobulin-like domain containing protein [Candidatus Cloacimonadota bacterium]